MTNLITRLTGACVAMCVAFGGGPIETASQAERGIRIGVTDFPRPLAVAVSQVERHFGRVVTYEDGSCVAPDDILDEGPHPGRAGARSLGRRLDSISLVYTPSEASVDAQVEEVLALLLAQWNRPSHSGEFRVERAVGGYHVIPVARRGVGGTTEPYASPLEARITIAQEERSLLETLSAVTQAISDSTGRRVGVTYRGMPRRLAETRVVVSAENQVARRILWEALQPMAPALSWRLLCEVGEDSACTLNVYRVAGGA